MYGTSMGCCCQQVKSCATINQKLKLTSCVDFKSDVTAKEIPSNLKLIPGSAWSKSLWVYVIVCLSVCQLCRRLALTTLKSV